MAEALMAITLLLSNGVEGKEYSNHASDKGGETYCGISRFYHPKWKGWQIIDDYKIKLNTQGVEINETSLSIILNKDLRLSAFVNNFYTEIFNRLRLSEINNQRIVNLFFQAAIHVGERSAIIWLQTSLCANGYEVLVDGKISTKGRSETIDACNALKNEQSVLEDFATKQRNYYVEIWKSDPSQQRYRNGWTNRVNIYMRSTI